MIPKGKRPRDPNQLAHLIVQLSTGEVQQEAGPEKNAAAVELGRKGGLKGGRARADSMTPEQRSRIAAKAAESRWRNRQ